MKRKEQMRIVASIQDEHSIKGIKKALADVTP